MKPPPAVFMHAIRDVTVAMFNTKAIVRPEQVEEFGKVVYDLVDRKNARKLILDLTRVQQLAPSAVTVLMNLKKKEDEIRGQVVLCGVQPELRKLFKLTGLQKLFKFYADEEGGLRAFGMTTAG